MTGTPVLDLLSGAAQGKFGLDHRFLHALLDRFDEAVPELVRFGLEDRSEDPVHLERTLLDLFRYRPRPEALPLFTDFVRGQPGDIPDELVEAFCRLGAPSIEPLLDLYRKLGPENGSEVAFALAALQIPDPRIEQLIQERLEDGDFLREVYGDQAAGLEPYDIWDDYPETAGPRLDLMGPERLFELAKADPDPQVRGDCWALLDLEEAQPVMLARLQDPAVPLAERCGALIGLSSGDDRHVPRYILEFYDIPEARAGAMEAMWRSLNPGYARYFTRHLDDPDLETRRAAILGAGYLRMHAELKRLEKYLFDEELRPDALRAYALASPGKPSALHARQVLVKLDKLADGLSHEEAGLVEAALDDLLQYHGLSPVFAFNEEEPIPGKPGRNDPCPCGSGKKYKKCCLKNGSA